MMIFWAHDESFASTHMSRSKGQFFVHVKVNEKGCKPQSRPWPQANEPENSIMLLMRPREYLLLQRLSPRPHLLLSRCASETHHVVAHMYIILLQGVRLNVDGWMFGWMDGCMVFFFSFFYLLALLDDEI
jgi:hypothetical protein